MMTSRDFAKPLIEKGVIPKNVRRMIIDVDCNCKVKVYYDTFGHESLLQLITPQMLMDGEEVKHADSTEVIQGERIADAETT